MLIAGIIRRVKMELYETPRGCVEPFRDHLVVIPKITTGVRATIVGINIS